MITDTHVDVKTIFELPVGRQNNFSRAYFDAIVGYELYGDNWTDLVEQAYAELQEAFYLGLPCPEFVLREWWVEHFYSWCYGTSMPQPLDESNNQVVECKAEGDYSMEIETTEQHVFYHHEETKPYFNYKLTKNSKGYTWEINYMGAVENPDEAMARIAEIDAKLRIKYGDPVEDK